MNLVALLFPSMRPLRFFIVCTSTCALQYSKADRISVTNNNDKIKIIDRSLQYKNPRDSYCGTTWPDAFESCSKSCRGGDDIECLSLGSGYKCFGYTGCTAKLKEEIGSNSLDEVGEVATGEPAVANNHCGDTWIDAMSSCTIPCPLGTECTIPGQSCYAATNCHVPLLPLRSGLLVTMAGPDRSMEGGDIEVFSQTMNDIIAEVAAEHRIKLRGVDVDKQTVVQGRRLFRFGKFNVTQVGKFYVTERFLPSGSSALDVSMVVTGDYRPPPYLDFDAIAEDSINRDAEKVVSVLQNRGTRAGSVFFERVNRVSSVAMSAATKRPTRTPTEKPTPRPIGPPTAKPSIEPSSATSVMPSIEPSRAIFNNIMTGSQSDMKLGGSTTSSYGDAGVVLITGIDFYTCATEEVMISLYTRIGNFHDFKNSTDGWNLIAQGPVKGRGIGRYTMIPEEMFTPVDIPGGGGDRGTRAFYLTMTTMDVVYKTGIGASSDSAIQSETPDIELWEGEGVLTYPLPNPSDPMAPFLFRYPRLFLGTIYYDRLPCKPFSAYGRIREFPCPDVPSQSPTLSLPSASPVTSPPSKNPVTSEPVTLAPFVGTPAPITPTLSPSISPTLSRHPSFAPSTLYPTASPIVPIRANINVNLRNVPDRVMTEREYEKFLELMLKFLQKYTEKSMAIEGIDLWHQRQVFVDASPNRTLNAIKVTPSHEKSVRYLLERETLEQILALEKKKKEQAIPRTTAMQLTLVLRVSFTFLPENLLAKMAIVAIEDNESELIMLLREQSSFYSYFWTLDGITSDTVLELTLPPTTEPTTLDFFISNQLEEVIHDESVGLGFGVMVGLSVGFLWCVLTGCSIVYLIKARTNMKEQRDVENLLRQAAPSHAGNAGVFTHKSSIPMGTDILEINSAPVEYPSKSKNGQGRIDRISKSRQFTKMQAKVLMFQKQRKSRSSKANYTIDVIYRSATRIHPQDSVKK